ncbi:hypothetical protein DS885_08545 [Psychromonas sp. B3M02]|nr:hypothetical protein DS885_08545 [Psychromonas sp. B3M02]
MMSAEEPTLKTARLSPCCLDLVLPFKKRPQSPKKNANKSKPQLITPYSEKIPQSLNLLFIM